MKHPRPAAISLAGAAAIAAAAVPAPVAAHALSGRLDSSLPLVFYLAGAAVVVAVSFAIAFAYDGRWQPGGVEPTRKVPRPIVLLMRAVGLTAWGWIVAQLIVGGSSSAEVGTLFTWVYGWVGIAIVSALLAPVWEWLDPFTTLHDLGAWVGRRLGFRRSRVLGYPARLAAWPAAVGFAFFVWLELAYGAADMGIVVVAYTIVTLVGMAVYGRDRWRAGGEVFSVWFGLLGRLARYVRVGPRGSGQIRRQRFPDGMLGSSWDSSLVALTAIATGAIIYDGLSQTRLFFDLFSIPSLASSTLLLVGFLLIVTSLALAVGRSVGMVAIGAGLLPISVGYLIAHYLTYLLDDGQRIVIAISDPFQLGWDLFGTVFFEPSIDVLPTSLLWAIIFSAVVGGHVLGAWAGHLQTSTRPARSGARQARLPLAIAMVTLTTVTLWSLGQSVFRPEANETATLTTSAAVSSPTVLHSGRP